MDFEIIGEIRNIELIARGNGIHDRARLRKHYGRGHWRKMKGLATVRLTDGTVHTAELHWYKPTASDGKKSSQIPLAGLAMKRKTTKVSHFAVCINNAGYKASLEEGKLYRVIPDEQAASHGYLVWLTRVGRIMGTPSTDFSHSKSPKPWLMRSRYSGSGCPPICAGERLDRRNRCPARHLASSVVRS